MPTSTNDISHLTELAPEIAQALSERILEYVNEISKINADLGVSFQKEVKTLVDELGKDVSTVDENTTEITKLVDSIHESNVLYHIVIKAQEKFIENNTEALNKLSESGALGKALEIAEIRHPIPNVEPVKTSAYSQGPAYGGYNNITPIAELNPEVSVADTSKIAEKLKPKWIKSDKVEGFSYKKRTNIEAKKDAIDAEKIDEVTKDDTSEKKSSDKDKEKGPMKTIIDLLRKIVRNTTPSKNKASVSKVDGKGILTNPKEKGKKVKAKDDFEDPSMYDMIQDQMTPGVKFAMEVGKFQYGKHKERKENKAKLALERAEIAKKEAEENARPIRQRYRNPKTGRLMKKEDAIAQGIAPEEYKGTTPNKPKRVSKKVGLNGTKTAQDAPERISLDSPIDEGAKTSPGVPIAARSAIPEVSTLEKTAEGGGSGIIGGAMDALGSFASGASKLTGLAVGGSAAALAGATVAAGTGIAGLGQALIGEDGILRGGSGSNFINDAFVSLTGIGEGSESGVQTKSVDAETKQQIAGEDIGPELTDKQRSVVDLSIKSGNKYSSEVMEKYNKPSTKKSETTNKLTKQQEKTDAEAKGDQQAPTSNTTVVNNTNVMSSGGNDSGKGLGARYQPSSIRRLADSRLSI